MDMKTKAYIYVAITVVTGALIPILVEQANAVGLTGFFMLTAFISTATGAAFLFYTKGIGKFVEVVRNPKTLFLSVLIGLLIFLPIEFGIAYAEKFVSASLATVLFRTSPLLMLPLLPLMLREKLTKYQIAALSLAFVGIYIGATGGTLGAFAGASLAVSGFIVMLAFVYALSTVMVKKYMIDMGSLLTVAAASLSVLFTALYLIGGGGAINLTMPALASVLFLGVGSNFLFFYMYFVGLRILKTTFVTNLISLSPFLTFAFASVLLGERILPYYLAIAALVGAGILIQHFDKLGGTYLARAKHHRLVMHDVSGAFADTNEPSISAALKKGGRVLALKLEGRHAGKVEELSRNGNHSNVFTDRHESINTEASFVKELLGAGEGDMVVMKAGPVDEGERFFGELSDALASPDGNKILQGTK